MVNPTDILKSSRISLHTDTCQAFVGKKKVNLTITEFNLLACFLKNGGTTLSRAVLLSTVWDQSYSGDGTHRGHPHPPASQQAGQGWVPHPNGPRCRIPVVGELICSTVGSADQERIGPSFLAKRGIRINTPSLKRARPSKSAHESTNRTIGQSPLPSPRDSEAI